MDPEDDPEELLRRAGEAFQGFRKDEGFALLLRSAAAGSFDREWVGKVAGEMGRWDPTRVWEVWQIRCSRPDAGAWDYLALARGHMFNARFHGTDVEPILPESCPNFAEAQGNYWNAVLAMQEAISRAEAPALMATLHEELATYHAMFGRYLECKIALENVAVSRAPMNRWRFGWEEHPGE